MARPVTCKYCLHTWHHENRLLQEVWYKDYQRCPSCEIIYCDLPETEKQLRELQDIFLINRNWSILNLMCPILEEYTTSLIKKKYIHSIDKNQLRDYAQKAVSLFIEYYLLDPKFSVTHSFAGLLRWKIKQACFNKKEIPIGDISMNYKLLDGNEIDYLDQGPTIMDYRDKIEQNYDKILLFKKLKELINSYDEYDSDEEKYYTHAGLYFYFYYGEKRASMFFRILEESDNKRRILKNKKSKKYNRVPEKKRGKIGKYHFLQIKDLLRKELLKN